MTVAPQLEKHYTGYPSGKESILRSAHLSLDRFMEWHQGT